MATRSLTWDGAVAIICGELEEYAAHRDAGRTPAETATAMGITPRTAEQYERTISTLLAALKTEATPSQARPEVAKAPTQ